MYKNKYCLLKSKYCPLSELPWERFALWCNDFGLLLITLLVFSNKDVLSFCVIICGCALRLILIVLFSISFSLLLSQLATFSSACLMICNLLVLSKEVDFSAKKQSAQGQSELCWKR